MAERLIHGIGVSEGIRIGKAFLYMPAKPEQQQAAPAGDAAHELSRLRAAKEQALGELDELIGKTLQTLGEEKAGILKGQKSFLNDPTFYPAMEQQISQTGCSAEQAVDAVVQRIAAVFEAMPTEYLRERAADVRDVGKRLLARLAGGTGSNLSDIEEEVILVADDLTPSDTVQLDKRFILGFVTRTGGKTSHTAILANSLGIPAILGSGDGIGGIQNGDLLIMDGGAGICVVSPDEATLQQYRGRMERENEERRKLAAFAGIPAKTRDGFRVELAANIGTPAEAQGLLEKGAEAVGLYRTEFLFMSREQMPDEETQYAAYKKAAEAMQGKPVVIRTLDIGGDKELPYLELPKEMNPFLGYRAIRLCLDRKELLVTQLRAILRASVHGKLKIMFPMISGIGEWRQAKGILDEVRRQLTDEGIRFDPGLETGIMIEIPSAALLAPRFAKEVDFFSIGTNDLVQYTVAVDRMNEKVAYLYDYFHPAVIRLLKIVIDASHEHGKWTGMCGSMAGDPLAAPLLLGLGLDEWSMSAASLQKVKRIISQMDRESCTRLAERVLDMDTPEEVRQALQAFAAEYAKNL